MSASNIKFNTTVNSVRIAKRVSVTVELTQDDVRNLASDLFRLKRQLDTNNITIKTPYLTNLIERLVLTAEVRVLDE